MADQTQEAKDRVNNYIDQTRAQLIDFLAEYVRFKSINPDMLSDRTATQLRQCQGWLEKQLQAWDSFDEVRSLIVDPEQPNVVARRTGQGSG